ELEPGWHAYWKNPGEAGMPPTIEWELPEGFSVEKMLWPHPYRLTLNESIGYGYHDEVILLAEITPPKKLADSIELGANIRWVVCDDASCLPGDGRLQTTVSRAFEAQVKNLEQSSLFSKARTQIPKPLSNAELRKKDGVITLTLDADEE